MAVAETGQGQERRAAAAKDRTGQGQEQHAAAAETGQGQERRAAAAETGQGQERRAAAAEDRTGQGQEQHAAAAETGEGQEWRMVAAKTGQEKRVVTRCFYSRKGTNKLLREEGKGRRKERKKWATAPFKDIRRPFGVTPQSILTPDVTPHSILPHSRWRQGSRPSSWHMP